MTLRSFSHKKWAVRICSALALCFLAAFLFFKSDDQEVSASRSGFYFDTAITSPDTVKMLQKCWRMG